MNLQFACKVRYTKQLDNGSLKRVNETYMVHAPTFGEAENEIYQHLGDVIKGEFVVEAITKVQYHEEYIFENEELETLYDVRVKCEDIDMDTDKVKNVSYLFLVNAPDAKDAYNTVMEEVKQSLVDPEITMVRESKIIEVFQPSGVAV